MIHCWLLAAVCVCGLFVFLSLCSSALKHFITGLQADPTYVRALMCKAEAHTELNQVHTPVHTVCNLSLSFSSLSSLYIHVHVPFFQYRDAVSDWSKAIHIYPNNPSFHLRQVCS